MTNTIMSSVQIAANQLLDTLIEWGDVTLDLTFQVVNEDAPEQLMAALNEEARRRGVGIIIDVKGETGLCLSLRHD